MQLALVTNHATTPGQKIRIILSLAVPAMVENLLQTIVGFTDTLFISKLGLPQVTAVGLANTILAVYLAVFMAVSVGTSALVAQSVGAGDMPKATVIARQATLISGILGLILGIIAYLFAEPLLQSMGADTQVLADGITYFRIVAVPSLFISLMITFSSILRAMGDTATPMKVGFLVNIVHILLEYVLVFGLWKLGGFGLNGAAWATVIVRILGTIALFRQIRKSKLAFRLCTGPPVLRNTYTLSLLKLSLPTAIERLIMRFGQVFYYGLIVSLGTATAAAHMIAGNIETFSYMPGYGLAVAATTLVGQNFGAKHTTEARCYAILTTGVAVVFMSFLGIIFFFFSPWLAAWFTYEKEVIQMVVIALKIDAFAQPALAIGLVLAGALQGSGDTKSPMYSTALGVWFIRVVGVYVLGIKLDMGITGVWLSIALDLFLRAAFLASRFQKIELWQQKK